MITIDGSYGEGGGQLIRTSLSLSSTKSRPFRVEKVRANRTKPGLAPQHLACVEASAALTWAKTAGAEHRSSEFTFEPGDRVHSGEYAFHIGSAGATALVGQTVLLPLAIADGMSTVRIFGGTHVPFAPQFDYLEGVYLPALRQFGVTSDLACETPGFMPQGQGQIVIKTAGNSVLHGIDRTERGHLIRLHATIITNNLPQHVYDRGAQAITAIIVGVGRTIEIEHREGPVGAPSTGAAITIVAECEGGSVGFSEIGQRGKPIETVAEKPCREFVAWWKTKAASDEHLADQLVLPAVLATEPSSWTTPAVSEHLRSALWLANHFVPIQVKFVELGPSLIRVEVNPEPSD